MLTQEVTAEVETIRARYPKPVAAMVPVLQVVQREQGWLSPDAQAWVAEFLSVTPLEVSEVVTFYPMLYDAPQGKPALEPAAVEQEIGLKRHRRRRGAMVSGVGLRHMAAMA